MNRWITNIEAWIAKGFLLAVFIVVVLQVFTRYVLNAPLSWTEEVARLCLVWLTFSSAILVANRDDHLTVVLVYDRLPGKISRLVDIIGRTIGAATSAVMGFAGFVMSSLMADVRLPATDLPVMLLYSASCIGFFLIFIHSVWNIVAVIRSDDDVHHGSGTTVKVAS